MKNIYLKYNPYKVDTIMKVSGEDLIEEYRFSEDNRINKKIKNIRLQHYLESNASWKGFFQEIYRDLNDNDLTLRFEGREIDYKDIEFMAKKFEKSNPEVKINLSFNKCYSDENKLSDIKTFFEDLQNGPLEELKTDEIKNDFEKALNAEFHINVIATMSSGKSTVINSLIGKELLPSKNEACTATIAHIKDNDDMNEFTVFCEDINKSKVVETQEASLEALESFNENEDIVYIKLEGPVPNISSKTISLVLVDTPGPNNSQDLDHEKITKDIINDKDKNMVLYVINATQIGVNDDKNLLQDISDAMLYEKEKQSRDRFIFILNKCDQLDEQKDGPISEIINKVKDYLGQFGIKDPNIFPISAELAKLIRMKQNDPNIKFSINQKQLFRTYEDYIEYECLHLEKDASLTELVKDKLNNRVLVAREEGDELEEALIHTGVPALEETINEYLEKYAYPIKIKKSIDSFNYKIEELEMLQKLQSDMLSSKERFEEIKMKIQDLEGKKNKVLGAKKINSEIKTLGIDEEYWKGIKEYTNKDFSKFCNELTTNEKVEKIQAEKIIERFKEYVSNLERSIELSLERKIEFEIKNKSNELYNKYQEHVKGVFEELCFENFRFEKLTNLNKLIVNESELNDIISNNIEMQPIIKDKKVKNKFVFKPWTWLNKPYKIEKKVVGEAEYVKISDIINSQMVDTNITAEKNIESAKEFALNEEKRIKEEFRLKLEALDQAIKFTIDDLKDKYSDREILEKEFKKNEHENIWLNKKVDNLNKILEM